MAPAAGNDEQVAALRKQLSVLKSDNEMLAEKLAKGGSAPADAPGAHAQEAQVVYAGDDQMASALAESKASLASVMAERDEYRDLLQRERMNEKEGKNAKKDEPDLGANARIQKLENERAELVKQLEFEKSRNEQIAAGKEAPPSSGASQSELEARLASVEAQKAKLQKQLAVAQNDVIAARQKMFSGKVDDKDVAELLAENKKLQTELAASNASAGGDTQTMQTEIAALRAQNEVLSQEINKRLAAAPTRAAMDNAAAEANYKVSNAKTVARKEVAADMAQANTRYEQAEAENIRLAKELAMARSQAAQPVPVVAAAAVPAPSRMAPIVDAAQKTPAAPAVPVVVAAAQPAPARIPQAVYTPASLGAMADAGPSGADIAGYLKRAGIPMVSGFEKVGKVSGPQFGAFRWDTGQVFGTAEQEVMPTDRNFEQAITAYLQKTKQRCSGTFDQSFDAAQMSTHKDFAVADVACVMPDGTGAGAAMVFFYKDGKFNVVAHEGDITQFDQAMTTRDSFAKFMRTVL
jgi:hypothetical protein